MWKGKTDVEEVLGGAGDRWAKGRSKRLVSCGYD